MYVALVQGSCDNEHNIVDHVAVGAVVQELCQRLIRLQQHTQYSELLVQVNNFPGKWSINARSSMKG